MTLKTFLDYLKFSGVWISFAINPCHWRLAFRFDRPNDTDPAMYQFSTTLGPLSVRAILDDGSW
jgi:hypothetical protein